MPEAQPPAAEPAGSGGRDAQPAGSGGRNSEELLARIRDTPGLAPLVGEAVTTWRGRAGDGAEDEPGWRAFSDAFPTFWEFSNRPR